MVEKAESVTSRSSKRRKNRKKRARQWSYYIDNLKSTIDEMYELCRSEQSVAGCKEAVLYLQNAANDFKSLIETINLEKEWNDQEPQKRQSVAWEVRKSMSSPNPVNITEKSHIPISSIIAEAVKNVGSSNPEPSSSQNTQESSSKNFGPLSYARIAAAASLAAAAVASEAQTQPDDEDGWQLVANRRRKSTSSTTVSEFDREISVEKEQAPSVPLNVYERLSSSSYKRGGSGYSNPRSNNTSNDANRLTCPRSAMDLPQTKASMAKMAYSRQLLWEKNQQILVEKLRAKQKREKSSAGCSRGSSTYGFTFADPVAVRKSVEAFNEEQKNKKVSSGLTETRSLPKSVNNRSLQSINENAEAETSANSPDDVPADPTPSRTIQSEGNAADETRSLFGYLEGLENDEEWREMTEEEESLALEENSLKLEIKQTEAISIDAELERQVEVEADRLEKEEKKVKRKKKEDKKAKDAAEYENFYKVFQEIQSLATVAWSEIMQNQHQSSSNVHEPGKPVEKHEKMSSPSRRKCEKDDDDYGKRHEMKIRKADELRRQLQEEKAARVKELTKRVEEVRAKKANLMERKKKMLEERMQRATENRDKNIMEVVKKAKDDDQRVLEVKFIANLQEDNKRYDIMMKESEHDEKQKQLADERARKIEEKAAKKREQKAAAEYRREMAAQARQERIRMLTEQKEARWAAQEKNRKTASGARKLTEKRINSNETSNWMDQLLALVEEEEETRKEDWTWPSVERFEIPKVCTVCEIKVESEIEAAAHLFSRLHGDKGIIMTTEQFRKQFCGVFKDDSTPENSLENPEKRMEEFRGMITSYHVAELIPKQLSSPRNRTKYIREFALSFEKMLTAAKGRIIEQSLQTAVEKALAELLSVIESEQGHVNIEQFCSAGLVPKLVDAILGWTSNGVSLRLCIRLCHTMCVLLNDARVAYSVLFKPELLGIIDRVVCLLKTDSSSPQLSALLDILNSLLKCVESRFVDPRRFKDLYNMDENCGKLVESLTGYIRASISRGDIENAMENNRGTAFLTKLIGFAKKLSILNGKSNNKDCIFIDYLQIALKFAYKLRRNVELHETDNEVASNKQSIDFSWTIIEMCQNLGETGLGKLLEVPEMLLMLVILLEDSTNRVTDALKMERKPKNEEILMKNCDLIKEISRNVGYYVMKKSLIISWTGGHGIVQNIRNLPLNYLIDPNFAKYTIGTIREVLDKLTVAEKVEAMGNLSDRFLDKNFVNFPV